MAMIPTVARTELPAAPVGAVRMDAGALSGAAAGMVRMGEAVQGIGNTLGAFALRKQDQVNRGILANEDTIRRGVAEQIQKHFDENPDTPEKWGEFSNNAWKSYEADRSKRQLDQKWGSDVKQADLISYQDYRSRAGVQFRAEQSKAEVRLANSRLKASAAELALAGDWEGAEARVAQMNLYPEQREKVLAEVQFQAVFGAINADPAGTLAALEEETPGGKPKNFKNLEESQRFSLKQSARGALISQQNEFGSDLMARRLTGEVVPESEVMGAVDRGLIRPAQAKAFLAQQQRDIGKQPATQAQKEASWELFDRINNWNLNDGDKAGEFELLWDILAAPDAVRSQLLKRFEEQRRPDSESRSESAKVGMTMISENFARGIYGPTTKREEIKEGRTKKFVTKTDAAGLAKAQERRAAAQTALVQFLKANPNATSLEVTKFLNDHDRKNRISSAWAPIIDPMTGEAEP